MSDDAWLGYAIQLSIFAEIRKTMEQVIDLANVEGYNEKALTDRLQGRPDRLRGMDHAPRGPKTYPVYFISSPSHDAMVAGW